MTWLWWLLAPVASTCLGGLLISWRARQQRGARSVSGPQAMAEHRALLQALAAGHAAATAPSTMQLLAPAAATERPSSGG